MGRCDDPDPVSGAITLAVSSPQRPGEHASSRLERRLDIDAVITAMTLTPAQQARFAEHRRVMACLWLAMLLPGNPGFARNPAGSVEDQARHVLGLLA